MASTHTTESCENNDLVLESKVSAAVFSPEDEETDSNVWPRPLLRKWTLMLFLGTCLLYSARMTMPICIVPMAWTFHWSKINSGLVLSGFFWGYCFTQILGGHASDRIGGERVLFISASSWALITAGTPLLASLGPHTLALMILSRFLMGLLQGVFFPSLASLCSQRVPEGERGLLMSTLHGGSHLGTLLAGGMGSLILDWYGWESMFYAIGFLSGLWALVVWQFFLKGSVAPKQMDLSKHSAFPSRALWLRLFKEPSVWYSFSILIPPCLSCTLLSAQPCFCHYHSFIFSLRAMVFAHMCVTGTSYVLLSWLPTYFKESFPRSKGWVYNVVPWMCAIPLAVSGGYVSDVLINKGYSVANVRKLMQTFSMGISGVFIMLLVGAARCHTAVIYVSAAVGLISFTSGGVSVNVQDLTPSCAGALFGFMNTLGAFLGVVLVSFSGYLIEVTLSWANVFSLITLINTVGLGLFLAFGDARRVDLEDHSPAVML